MRAVMAGLLTLSLGGLALALDDLKPGGAQPQSRADRLQAIRDEQSRPLEEYRKALGSAKTAEEKQATAREYTKTMTAARTAAAEGASKLVEEDPKDDV